MSFFTRAYITHNTSLADPRLSPNNSAASAFPDKVLLVVCEHEPLCDEAMEFSKILKAGGKDVDMMEVPRA
jgi:acetyl esterase/lipase